MSITCNPGGQPPWSNKPIKSVPRNGGKNTMTIEERAEQFALEALKEQIEKVKQAYIAGYKECEENYKKITVDEDGFTWYDLDLPSGNLWSEPLKDEDGKIIKLNYGETANLDLPTAEDVKEMQSKTARLNKSNKKDTVYFKSVSSVEYPMKKNCNYWVRDNSSKTWGKIFSTEPDLQTDFVGIPHPVILIKRK